MDMDCGVCENMGQDFHSEGVNGQERRGIKYVQVGSVISANVDIISK